MAMLVHGFANPLPCSLSTQRSLRPGASSEWRAAAPHPRLIAVMEPTTSRRAGPSVARSYFDQMASS